VVLWFLLFLFLSVFCFGLFSFHEDVHLLGLYDVFFNDEVGSVVVMNDLLGRVCFVVVDEVYSSLTLGFGM